MQFYVGKRRSLVCSSRHSRGRTCRCFAKFSSRYTEGGRNRRNHIHARRDGAQEGCDESPEREDARERIEKQFQPTQYPLCRRLLLLDLHILQIGDERVEVALHLYDALRKRTRGRGDDVGEPPRVRAAILPFRTRLGRIVDLPRHQKRKMGVAAKDIVGGL